MSETNDPPRRATLYTVPGWDRDFENSKSRQVERATFFCVQNHFDGKKIRRLARQDNGLELYGAFHAVAAIASKCWYRGVCMDADGPIDARGFADKTGFPQQAMASALAALSDPALGLLEKDEIAFVDGKWQLPERVLEWAIPQDQRRAARDTERRGPTRSGRTPDGASHVRNDSAPQTGNGTARRRASAGVGSEAGEDAERLEEKGREQNRREVAPAVPTGDETAAPAAVVYDRETAKELICRRILDGKNPGRIWSPDAENRLSLMCEQGIPVQEIDDIAQFRSIPKRGDSDPDELKKRKDPITETTLVLYWADELTRARSYLKKHSAAIDRKKEPPNWRDFFNWKYGGRAVLPIRFEQLARAQREEWESEHEDFDAVVLPKLQEQAGAAA